MKKLRRALFALLLFTSNISFSQSDSCTLRISLLTCSPGAELYSTFGHTALRVTDLTTGSDLIYNYGTFDFNDEFYPKFVLGKLLYYLSVETFDGFVYAYQMEGRSVVEQLLNLTCEEKTQLSRALQVNALEQNKYYRYDFLYDNCTSRVRDIVKKLAQRPFVYNNILEGDIPSFRNLIHSYLDKAGQYWSKFGIDILMGTSVDKKVTNEQAMFLPDYLYQGFDSARINNEPLVSQKGVIYKAPEMIVSKSLFRPFYVFLALLLFMGALQFLKARWAATLLKVLDFICFFLTGVLGIIMLFMWFGTDHQVCRNNFNLLWAIPTNAIAAFFLFSRKEWVRKYFSFVFWISILLAFTWFLIPQHLNIAVAPLILLQVIRSNHYSKKANDGRKINSI